MLGAEPGAFKAGMGHPSCSKSWLTSQRPDLLGRALALALDRAPVAVLAIDSPWRKKGIQRCEGRQCGFYSNRQLDFCRGRGVQSCAMERYAG